MKKLISFLGAILITTSCCFAAIVSIKSEPISINDSLSLSIVSIKYPVTKVTAKGGSFWSS